MALTFPISAYSSITSDFAENMRLQNHESKTSIKNLFAEELKDVNDKQCAVFLTDSDGRREKMGNKSPYELIVVFKNGISANEKESLTAKIQAIAQKYLDQFDQIIEFKELHTDSTLNYESKVIPTRAMDSLKVWGNKAIKREYLDLFYDQLKSANNYQKFSKDFRQSSLRQMAQCLKQQSNPMHMNYVTGELIYDDEKNKATKWPCLRPMQYHVAHLIFKNVRNGKISRAQFEEVRKCRTIAKKIEWLRTNGHIKISAEEANKLCKTYHDCINWYVAAQNHFLQSQAARLNSESKEQSLYRVSVEELKKNVSTISSFVKSE